MEGDNNGIPEGVYQCAGKSEENNENISIRITSIPFKNSYQVPPEHKYSDVFYS